MESVSRLLLNFLLNSLWQVPLIALVVLLIDRMLRHGPASHRHAVWVAALAASVAVPLVSARRPAPPEPVRFTVSPDVPALPSAAVAVLPAPTPQRAPVRRVRSIPLASNTATALVGIWLAFTLFCSVRFLAAFRRTHRIVALAKPCRAPALEALWSRCARAFQLTDVELRSSSAVSTPVAAGVRTKTVILPDALLAEPSEDVLATAIGHEMAHLARHDFLSKIVYETLHLPLAFHPAAWFIRNQIERTREMACDELVTRRLLDPHVYARSIVSIASSAVSSRPALALGIFDGGNILEERIRRLLDRPAANLRRARLLLAAGLSTLAVCAVIASGLAITARAQSGSLNEIKLGADAFNAGDAKAAIQHFRAAVLADPSAVRPKLFLAGVLIREYEPGNPQQAALAAEIRQQLLNVLTLDNRNVNALGSLMMLDTNTKQFAEAHDWAQKLIEADPQQTGGYYTIGFIDWSTAYPPYMAARTAAGMRPEDPGTIPDASLRLNLAPKISPQIEEGLRMLHTALEIDPRYTDAMAYTNLLLRIKAAIADSPAESAALTAQADAWVQKAVAAKRAHEAARSQTPSAEPKLDANGPAPGAAFVVTAPPPPPPPPPPANLGNQPVSSEPLTPAAFRRSAAEHPGSYWQVYPPVAVINGSQAAKMLRAKGFQVSVVEIVAGQDNFVRVLVGPYTDSQSLAQAKADLEAAGFTPLRVLGQ